MSLATLKQILPNAGRCALKKNKCPLRDDLNPVSGRLRRQPALQQRFLNIQVL